MGKRILVLLTFYCNSMHSQDETLFPIIENNLWGYMNVHGKIVIQPQFKEANKFSEGFAAVRVNGRYGYINPSGEMVIKPIFDFATSFNEGYAFVYINGIPQIIKKDGKPIFTNVHPGLYIASQNRFVITTTSKRQGVLNNKGEWIIDTIFSEITPTENNLYIVRSDKELKSKSKDIVGVIAEDGNFIVPYFIYRSIWPYNSGLARVKKISKKGKDDLDGFIDLNGKLVFKIKDTKIWDVKNFDGEFSKVSLSVKNNSNDDLYEGYIDRSGNLVIDNQEFDWVYQFVNNRAFVQKQDNGYYLINRSGKFINKTPYDEVAEESFVDGKAIVNSGDDWEVIDTNANVLIKKEIEADRIKYINNTLFFYNDKDQKWGFWNLSGNYIPETYFDYFDLSGFKNNLLLVQDERKFIYIDKTGKKIWEQIIDTNRLMPLNIDYMNRGYYYAYSAPLEKELKYDGWAQSSNLPRKNAGYDWVQKNKLNVNLSKDDTTMNYNIMAKKLFIINETSDTIYFPAQDSRLYLKIQALNLKGEWKDIEYLPSSWCGNSYHTLQLAPGEYWTFATPAYDGEFKTKLRAELKYQIALKNSKETKYIFIYSNEFEANINPAQFWRKLEYHPGGLMDPYND